MTNREADSFYKALRTRDARFDGKFFVGVRTTGIYCRPICPATTPKRQNVEFYMDAYAAEKAGYRPCLRCRPESAPLSPAWVGRSATVQRALKILQAQKALNKNADEFAAGLGVSARHLRRLFEKEIGKTPQQIFAVSRLNFARKLIVETELPITEIAFTSGFESIRRFNAAFKTQFHRAPSALRKPKNAKLKNPMAAPLRLRLAYRTPFDWQALLGFYRSHPVGGVEHLDENFYSRVFNFDGVTGAFKLSPAVGKPELELEILCSDHRALFQIVQNVRRMFDLNSDPLLLEPAFMHCKYLRRLHRAYAGLRLPLAWDAFECGVAAILGQLVSVKQGERFLRQLVEAYGTSCENPFTGEKAYYFPAPEVLTRSDLAAVGLTKARKQAVKAFALAVSEKKISLDPTQNPENFRARLLEIPGIGPWTADYVSLRALGDTDAFPKTDLVLKRQLQKFPRLDVDSCRPWRAYAAFYLWRSHYENSCN